MTQNQKEFNKLVEKLQKYQRSAERKGIVFEGSALEDLLNYQGYKTKKILKQMRQITRSGVFEMGFVPDESGELVSYQIPEEEKRRRSEVSKKGWVTRRRKQKAREQLERKDVDLSQGDYAIPGEAMSDDADSKFEDVEFGDYYSVIYEHIINWIDTTFRTNSAAVCRRVMIETINRVGKQVYFDWLQEHADNYDSVEVYLFDSDSELPDGDSVLRLSMLITLSLLSMDNADAALFDEGARALDKDAGKFGNYYVDLNHKYGYAAAAI